MKTNDWAQKAAEDYYRYEMTEHDRYLGQRDKLVEIIRARYQEWRREHGIPYWVQNNSQELSCALCGKPAHPDSYGHSYRNKKDL